MGRITTLLKECEQCGEEFTTLDHRKRFCNRSCSATWSNRNYPKRIAKVKVKKPRKTGLQKWLDGEWDGTVKSGLSATIRLYLLEQADYKCEECSWSGFNPVSGKSTLTVDHTDGDSTNNRRENLKVLCPNCHSLTPTYGALNKGNGRKSRYVELV